MGARAVKFTDLVEKVGGSIAMANLLDVSITEVEYWRLTNYVPKEHQLSLWKIAVVYRLDWKPPNCNAFVLRSKVLESIAS